MNIVFTDFIEMPANQKQRFIDMGVTVYDDVPADDAEIIRRIKDAELITANYINITKEHIDNAPKLKYIVVPAVGFEWIDHAYAASKNIQVVHCPTHNSHAVAEHAIALLFAVKRRILEAVVSLQKGEWRPKDMQGGELKGKSMGIVGYGRIGKDVEAMAKGLGMQTMFANTSTSATELDALLKTADVVCLCLPINNTTHQLLNKRRLELLQPHAVLINVGRGTTLDQATLYTLLQQKRIAGAGLDVFEHEPLGTGPGAGIVALASLPTVVATPHMAYNTTETAERLGDELYKNIQSCLLGKARNVVN